MEAEDLLWIAAAAVGIWWLSSPVTATPPTTPPATKPPVTPTPDTATARAQLYAFLNANYHAPAGFDPGTQTPTDSFAVNAAATNASPAFAAGTVIIIYSSALTQYRALVAAAGGSDGIITAKVTSGGTTSGGGGTSSGTTTVDKAAAQAALAAFLAGLSDAPAGYTQGQQIYTAQGYMVVWNGKLVPVGSYADFQQLRIAAGV